MKQFKIRDVLGNLDREQTVEEQDLILTTALAFVNAISQHPKEIGACALDLVLRLLTNEDEETHKRLLLAYLYLLQDNENVEDDEDDSDETPSTPTTPQSIQ